LIPDQQQPMTREGQDNQTTTIDRTRRPHGLGPGSLLRAASANNKGYNSREENGRRSYEQREELQRQTTSVGEATRTTARVRIIASPAAMK
jgi:hypothetical protein